MSLHALALLGMSLLAAPAADAPANVLIRISGPLTVAAGESVRTAIVIDADGLIEGEVTDQLVVIGGTARVRGVLAGGATVISGTLVLEPSARVHGTVALYRSVLERSPDAMVSGRIMHELLPTFRDAAWLLWAATTLVLILAALAWTFLARAPLTRAAELLRRRPGPVGIATLALVPGLPLLAFILLATGVGVPVALALVVFVLPALAFLGYVITGTSIGQLVGAVEPRVARNPYVAAALGVLMLQLLAAVPPFGGLFALLATQVGAGALAYYVWRQHRREGTPAPV